MDGDSVVKWLEKCRMASGRDVVDENDAQGFEAGAHVEVYPADWGSEHRASGRLVALAPDCVTIMGEGAMDLRIHAPRTGFKVTLSPNGGTKL